MLCYSAHSEQSLKGLRSICAGLILLYVGLCVQIDNYDKIKTNKI